MQELFDELYAKSLNGEIFTNLMDFILKDENILLAYRNVKTNGGSETPGTDGLSIKDIAKLKPQEVVEKVKYLLTNKRGYKPRSVRRKEIPKPNGSMRPLGIPCIWDRLIQQCIKQVLEPICEAKFSNNSYGFRPNRSVENAIARTYRLLQMSNLHFVICFDIKGFFDNVNHKKLIQQMWSLGIRDKQLIWIIKSILRAPIKMPDNTLVYPQKGTPQGGIISPLLANIVLNELDHWVESQWQTHPIINNYKHRLQKNGTMSTGHAYRGMRDGTSLKEMFIVRYADDFRIFCRYPNEALRTKFAITKWLKERLYLDISEEKTCIIDARKKYFDFLGFSIKVFKKSPNSKYVVTSHISQKALEDKTKKLVDQAKVFCHYADSTEGAKEIVIYNSMVMGIQNYYRIATQVSKDLFYLQNRIYTIMYNRLNTQSGNKISHVGRKLTKIEEERYGKSKSLRYVVGTREPVYPISYVQFKNPMAYNRKACIYTPQGRAIVHDNLRINTKMLIQLMNQKIIGESIEFYDNRISLFSAQWGKCFVTNKEFQHVSEIHCHHKIPKEQNGKDEYDNLVLVHVDVHKLIHAINGDTIDYYYQLLNLSKGQIGKVNELRELLNLPEIKYRKKSKSY